MYCKNYIGTVGLVLCREVYYTSCTCAHIWEVHSTVLHNPLLLKFRHMLPMLMYTRFRYSHVQWSL